MEDSNRVAVARVKAGEEDAYRYWWSAIAAVSSVWPIV
jgi:hypothetical protein